MNKLLRQPDALLGWMDSLADATRLRLLLLLERHELGVVELCDVLQMPQSTVSRHLKVLADQRWIVSRRQGTTNLYHMVQDDLEPAARKLWLLAREQTHTWPAIAQDQLRLTRRLSQKLNEAESFFAGAAGQWGRLRTELYGHRYTQSAIAALLPAHWVVADLGCGTGDMAVELAPYVRQVIGVDQSAAMLKAARKLTAQWPQIDLRRGDLADLPIEDSACDGVLISLVLTYVPDPLAVLREAARILKPGGLVVVVDLLHHDREDFRRQMGQHWTGFEIDTLTQWLTAAGMAQPRVHPLAPEPQAKGPALLLARALRKPA